MIFGSSLYRDDLSKVSFILNSYNDYLQAVKDFSDLQVGTWDGASETALFGDFGVKNTSKAHAIKVLPVNTFKLNQKTDCFRRRQS